MGRRRVNKYAHFSLKQWICRFVYFGQNRRNEETSESKINSPPAMLAAASLRKCVIDNNTSLKNSGIEMHTSAIGIYL